MLSVLPCRGWSLSSAASLSARAQFSHRSSGDELVNSNRLVTFSVQNWVKILTKRVQKSLFFRTVFFAKFGAKPRKFGHVMMKQILVLKGRIYLGWKHDPDCWFCGKS